jgi:hypothetical protein
MESMRVASIVTALFVMLEQGMHLSLDLLLIECSSNCSSNGAHSFTTLRVFAVAGQVPCSSGICEARLSSAAAGAELPTDKSASCTHVVLPSLGTFAPSCEVRPVPPFKYFKIPLIEIFSEFSL